MDFEEVSKSLKAKISAILDSSGQIERHHVKQASSILNTVARLKLNDTQARRFLDDVVLYFVLLNHYSDQFKEINASQQCTVRMGLGVLLYVVECTHIEEAIFKKFMKVIDVVSQSSPNSFNIKEYLRVYSHLLDKTPVEVLKTVVHKQKSFPIWYDIIKNTSDIETQAIIMEVVIKIIKCNNEIVDETFIEILEIVDVSSITKTNMYQNIRMILDQFNESSSKIFSVNCSSIKLDSRRVVEFDGAVGDVWLDLNLSQNRLSFFCDQFFAGSKVKMYPTSTTWEVLWFYAKDTTNQSFNYNRKTGNLEISLLISAENINLLARTNGTAVHSIEVLVSKDSRRFLELVEHLPKMFPASFSAETAGIPSRQELESSRTPDIFELSDDGSSPIIEHFEMCKKISEKFKNVSYVELSDDSCVVSVSEAEDDVPKSPNKPKNYQVLNGSLECNNNKLEHISATNNILLPEHITDDNENKIGAVDKECNKTNHFNSDHETSNALDKSVNSLIKNILLSEDSPPANDNKTGVIEKTKNKTNRSDLNLDASNVLEKSVSSLVNNTLSPEDCTHNKADKEPRPKKKSTNKTGHFQRLNTSNVFNKSVSPLSFTESVLERRSRPQSRNSNIENVNTTNAKKISAINKTPRKGKVSTRKTTSKSKISSSLPSVIIKPYKAPLDTHDDSMTEDLEIEERMMDVTFDYMDANVDFSIAKVENWLKTVPEDAPVAEDVECAVPDLPPSISERGSVLPPQSNEDPRDLPDFLSPSNQKDSTQKAPQDEDTRDLPEVRPSPSERGSSMPLEEKMQMIMGENLGDDQPRGDGDPCDNTVEDLLYILNSQESENVEADDLTSSHQSEVPLAKLAKIWKRQKKEDEVAAKQSGAIDSRMEDTEVADVSKTSHAEDIHDVAEEAAGLDLVEDMDSRKDESRSSAVETIKNTVHDEVPEVERLEKSLEGHSRLKSTDTNVSISSLNLNNADHNVILTELEALDKSPVKSRPKFSIISMGGSRTATTIKSSEKPDRNGILTDKEEKSRDDKTPLKKETLLHKSLNGVINQAQPPQKARRRLYNPDDLSYLNSSLTEYLQSESKKPASPEVIVIPSRSAKSKTASKRKSRGDGESGSNIKNRFPKKATSKKPSLNISLGAGTSKAVPKSLNGLKETFRKQKQRIKLEKKLKSKKGRASTSSSSSMEPFGVGLKNLRNEKRKSLTPAENVSVKRLKEETSFVDEEKPMPKIKILSDVVIKPAEVRSVVEESLSSEAHCAEMLRAGGVCYLQVLTFVSRMYPALLDTPDDVRNGILEILQGCGES